jgi:hypothetical protein
MQGPAARSIRGCQGRRSPVTRSACVGRYRTETFRPVRRVVLTCHHPPMVVVHMRLYASKRGRRPLVGVASVVCSAGAGAAGGCRSCGIRARMSCATCWRWRRSAQRIITPNPEGEAGTDGYRDVDHQDLEQFRHGHAVVVGRFGPVLMRDVSHRITTALQIAGALAGCAVRGGRRFQPVHPRGLPPTCPPDRR